MNIHRIFILVKSLPNYHLLTHSLKKFPNRGSYGQGDAKEMQDWEDMYTYRRNSVYKSAFGRTNTAVKHSVYDQSYRQWWNRTDEAVVPLAQVFSSEIFRKKGWVKGFENSRVNFAVTLFSVKGTICFLKSWTNPLAHSIVNVTRLSKHLIHHRSGEHLYNTPITGNVIDLQFRALLCHMVDDSDKK